MNILKKIPIKYLGELHDIRLINFSVDINEVKDKVPYPIKIRDFNGRALFSMVDVKLKNMRPSFSPTSIHFNYRHIAFRLLVEDSVYNNGVNKGLFFYKSFTDQPIVIIGGNLFTDYKLESAKIIENGNEIEVCQHENYVRYSIEEGVTSVDDKVEELKRTVGALDRAYSLAGKKLRVTQIQREKWPIQPVKCTKFENTFFKTAKLEGAFKVFEIIYYQWLPPREVVL